MSLQNTAKSDLQRHLVCEGTRTVNAWQVRWSNRFLAIGRGYDEDGDIAQFVNITMPGNGTLIPKSVGGSVTVQAAPNGIVLQPWETLYYDPAPSGNANQGSFVIVPYTDQFIAPDSWVWIAKRVGNDHVEWGDRQRDNGDGAIADFWRTPATNGSLPDGSTDTTETISRAGKVGIGNIGASNPPTSMLDLANVARSGTHSINPNTGAYLSANSGGWGRNSDFVPLANGTAVVLGLRHSNGTQGLAFGYNGIQHESRNPANVGQVFMIGTNHENTAHALGWPDFNSNGVAVREKIIAVHPEDGERWVDRYSANGAIYAEMQIGQAHAYRPGEDQRQAYYDLLLAQTGGSYGMRPALRIAPVAGPQTTAIGRNKYQSFSHYFQPTALHGALATLVLWQHNGVLEAGAQLTNQWAGIGTWTGSGGGTQAIVATSGRVNGPHHWIGEASRASNIHGTPTTALMETIQTIWDDGNRSRIRFGLGLPRGAARPGGLVSGELWLDTSAPGDPIVRCVA